jgi:hypothetical protein
MITNEDAAHLLAGLDLGSTVAELDNLLETARVETSVFDDLLADRVDLIPGTKGSGKTALYRMFVDFLPQIMLTNKKIIIAHGVQQRQDTVFLAYKNEEAYASASGSAISGGPASGNGVEQITNTGRFGRLP